MSRFGELLRAYRISNGLSLRGLARLIGLSPSYLSGIENSKLNPPTRRRVNDIATVLQLEDHLKKQFFESAGYVSLPEDTPIGRLKRNRTLAFASPIKVQPSEISEVDLLNSLHLRGVVREAVREVIELLSSESLTSAQRRVLAKHIRTFAQGLKITTLGSGISEENQS